MLAASCLLAGCATPNAKTPKPRWAASPSAATNRTAAQHPPTQTDSSHAAPTPPQSQQHQPPTAADATQPPSQQAVLAIVLPLSGPYAVHGQRALVAAQLALGVAPEEIRQEPFQDTITGLRVWVVDSAGQAEQIEHSINLLQQHASIIVGALVPQVARVLAAHCQSAAIPFISLANRKDIAQTGSWIFGMALTLQQQIDALVRWSIQQQGMRRFAIFYPRNRYGQQALQALQDAVQQYTPTDPTSSHAQANANAQANQHEAEIVATGSYEPQETTFTLPVRQMVGLHPIKEHPEYASCQQQAAKQAARGTKEFTQAKQQCLASLPPIVNFDALLLPTAAETAGYIIPALVSQDILVSQDPHIKQQYQIATKQKHVKPVQLLGTNLWHNAQLQHRLQQATGSLGEHMEGALFVDGMSWEQAGALGQQFAQAFQERVGSKPSWESRVYDAITLAAWTLRQHTTVATTQGLRQHAQNSLANTTAGMAGMTGPISFDSDGNWIPTLVQFIIRENTMQNNQQ